MSKTSCLLILILITVSLSYLFNSSLQEGVTFTNYSNSKLLVKPWDEFCVQDPPSCQNNDNFLLTQRNPPIGCWCKNQKATLAGNDCTDMEYDPFIEFRR